MKITNTDENTTREAKTNGSGDYELLNVLPAHYAVAVTATGFQSFAASHLSLVADRSGSAFTNRRRSIRNSARAFAIGPNASTRSRIPQTSRLD